MNRDNGNPEENSEKRVEPDNNEKKDSDQELDSEKELDLQKQLDNLELKEKEVETTVEGQRVFSGLNKKIVALVAIMFAGYHLTIAFLGVPEPFQLRPIHLGFAMFLGFVIYPFSKKSKRDSVPWYDWILAGISVAIPLHIQLNYERITWRFPYLDELTMADMILGVLLVILIMELTRRIVGWALVILALLFVGHSLLGKQLPGILYHPGVSVNQFIDHIYLTNTGIYGSILGVSATYIFLFILFGAFLQKVGASKFFMSIAISLTKKERGGPAKAAVIGSAFFGMISGSAVANVYTTGAITIPLMIRSGFKRTFAAGVEAVSSASGQVMPPIMGTAAFLIAEFTNRAYIEVATAAIVPSLLYLFAVYCMVHFQALKTNLPLYRQEDLPNMSEVFKRDFHLLFPIGVLVFLLVSKYTPYFAAFWAILALVAISFIRAHTRQSIKGFLEVMESGAKKATPIAVAIACASIIVGTTELSGVAYKFSSNILDWSGGNLPIALILIAVATIILGMDLPIVVSFLIASLFGVPVLMELGVDRFIAYMFVFYYAILATITPPVCMSAFAGASIAGCSMMRAGLQAVQIGISAYILPAMFVYNPSLLYQGDLMATLPAAFTAAIGIVALASGVQGYLVTKSYWFERIMMLSTALLLIKPGSYTDIVGFAIIAIVVLLQTIRAKVNPLKAILGRVDLDQLQQR